MFAWMLDLHGGKEGMKYYPVIRTIIRIPIQQPASGWVVVLNVFYFHTDP